MDSSNLNIKKEFSAWQSFSKITALKAPTSKGVYVLRLSEARLFGRLKEKSDILYIGCTKAKGGLRQRLYGYFKPGSTQWTNQRINKFLSNYTMEISWRTCEIPINVEHYLLKQYLKDHDELPPFNRSSSRRLLEPISENLGLTENLTVILTRGNEQK